MNEIVEAIVLGIVQGLTEFLPVSSSGHLELAKWILKDDSVGQQSLLMTVILHAATALATLIVFRNDVIEIIRGLFRPNGNEERSFALKIIVSMIPAAFVGLFFEASIEALFSQRIVLVGSMLLVTGALLFLADRAKDTVRNVSILNAFIIGISQAIAIMPGISRSGATISTSVLLGIDRSKAARFSFLMVVPLILGKVAKDLLDGDLSASTVDMLPLSIGFIAALVAGIIACQWMIVLVKKAKLSYFAIYCFIVGIVAIIISLVNN